MRVLNLFIRNSKNVTILDITEHYIMGISIINIMGVGYSYFHHSILLFTITPDKLELRKNIFSRWLPIPPPASSVENTFSGGGGTGNNYFTFPCLDVRSCVDMCSIRCNLQIYEQIIISNSQHYYILRTRVFIHNFT